MTDFSYKDFQFDHYSSIGEKGYSKDLETFSRKKLFGSLIVRKDGTLKELGFLKTILNYFNNKNLKNLTKLRAMHFIAYGIKRQNLLSKADKIKDHLDKIAEFARRVGIEKDDIKRLNKLVQANTDKGIDAAIEEFYTDHSKEYQPFEKECVWIHNYTQDKGSSSFVGGIASPLELSPSKKTEKQAKNKPQDFGPESFFAAQLAARYKKSALNLLEEEEALKRAKKAEAEHEEAFKQQQAEKRAEDLITSEERRSRGKKKHEAKQQQVKEERERKFLEALYRADMSRRRKSIQAPMDESTPDFEDYDITPSTRTFFDLRREIEEKGELAGNFSKTYYKLFDDFKQKFSEFKIASSDTDLKDEIKIKSINLARVIDSFKEKMPQIRTFFLEYRMQALKTIERMVQAANHDVEKAQELGSANLQNLKKTENALEQTKRKVIKSFQNMEEFIAIADATKGGENSLDLATKMLSDPDLEAIFKEEIKFLKKFYEANAKDEEGGDANWD